MGNGATERGLLFGLLALQNGLIEQDQLLAAFRAWSRDKARSIADHLVDRGDLDASRRVVLDGLVDVHVAKHGGDAEKSLASIAVGRATREAIRQIGDPEVNATLSVTGLGSTVDGATDRTTHHAVVGGDGRRFRVLRRHAQGGLGAVFVALDGELNREVALKQILDHHADDESSRTRFLLEAEITGGLEHPGIVPVYGLGTYGDGRPYYAMRFIKGESLKDAIAAFHDDRGLADDPGMRSLALRDLLRRFVDVCNAIEYAHGRGILHRDIKPANIIVGKHGETLVVDWGLAKAVGRKDVTPSADERTLAPSSSSGSAETLPGAAMGTPAYMSPEQACGDLDRLGPRSDVYSLGATLYCLLTGRPPFEGGDLGRVIRDVQGGEFPPPRRAKPEVGRALEAVCLKAMALRPEDRYPSSKALADDVERWSAGEPVSAWREPWAVRARRWASRRRTLVTVAGAATLLAAVVFAASTAIAGRALLRETRALAEMTAARNAEYAARRGALEGARKARDIVDRLLSMAGTELKEVQGAEGLRLRLLSDAAMYFDEAVSQGVDDAHSRRDASDAAYRLGQIRRALGQDPAALAAFDKALALRGEILRADPGDFMSHEMVGNTHIERGLVFRAQGRLPEAEAECRAAIDACTTASRNSYSSTDNLNNLASAYNNLGLVLREVGRLDEAGQAYRKAFEIRSKALEKAPRNPFYVAGRGSIANQFARLEVGLGKLGGALDHAEESVRFLDQAVALSPENPDYLSNRAWSRATVGIVLAHAGRDEEADRAVVRAIDEHQAVVDRNPGVPQFRSGLAFARTYRARPLARLGRDRDAAEGLSKAVEQFDALRKLEPNTLDHRQGLARSLTLLAGALRRVGRVDEAFVAAGRAVEEAEALVAKAADQPAYAIELASALTSLGESLAAKGRGDDAARSLGRAVEVAGKLAGSMPAVPWHHEQLARSWAALGAVHRASGRGAEALDAAEHAVNSMRRASETVPEAAYLRQDLDAFTRARDALLPAPRRPEG